MENRFTTNYNDGAYLDIAGNDDKTYLAMFYDNKNGELIYQTELKCNNWARTSREYYTEWRIEVFLNGNKVFTDMFNCDSKNVLIAGTSNALGDNIAFAPYFEEFRNLHNCNLIVRTKLHKFLKEFYPYINWVEIDAPVDNVYATYDTVLGLEGNKFGDYMEKINNSHNFKQLKPIDYIKGLTFENKNNHKEHPMSIPLQKIISNILGLEYKERRPHFNVNFDRPIEEKYICIAEFAASGKSSSMKTWNNQVGWKTLVSELQKKGYKVISISKEKSDLNIIKRNGDYSLFDRMQYLQHAEFFICVSSGLAWLNWAVGKKTVMISGFTKEWNEFQEDNIRIINKTVCNGCYNSKEHADKLVCFHNTFCPENRNFECTRKISPKMALDKIIENNLI
jgi:Glycosyltransferase family 9 (heptosyltransferase)